MRILGTIIRTLMVDVLSRQADGLNGDVIGPGVLSVVILVGGQPCFFSSLRINFNAAWAFRFDCTRKSRTSPSLSTARHNQ